MKSRASCTFLVCFSFAFDQPASFLSFQWHRVGIPSVADAVWLCEREAILTPCLANGWLTGQLSETNGLGRSPFLRLGRNTKGRLQDVPLAAIKPPHTPRGSWLLPLTPRLIHALALLQRIHAVQGLVDIHGPQKVVHRLGAGAKESLVYNQCIQPLK